MAKQKLKLLRKPWYVLYNEMYLMKVRQLTFKSKLLLTKMPSATQTKVTNDSPKEFTYTPPSQYSVDEHMETANWNWKHPSIPDSFFLKLQPPKNLEDAHTWMCCHQHNLEDYTVQMELNELEMAMLCDNGAVSYTHLTLPTKRIV